MLGLAAIGVTVASTILNIVGLAIPYWIYISVGDAKSYVGLWEACGSSGGQSACITLPDAAVTGSLQGVRACEILGMILILGTIICFVMKQFVLKDMALLPKVGSGLAILAGVLMIVGCVVFAADDKLHVEGTNLHAGFALCIVSGILAFIAAGFGFMIRE